MPNENQDNERTGMSRREFASRVGLAAAAAAVAPALHAAPLTDARVRGANDRVVMASIGIRGQGNALKRGFAKLNNVAIKTLCDIDANLGPERINDTKLADVPTFRPGFEQDLRRVVDRGRLAPPLERDRQRPVQTGGPNGVGEQHRAGMRDHTGPGSIGTDTWIQPGSLPHQKGAPPRATIRPSASRIIAGQEHLSSFTTQAPPAP